MAKSFFIEQQEHVEIIKQATIEISKEVKETECRIKSIENILSIISDKYNVEPKDLLSTLKSIENNFKELKK